MERKWVNAGGRGEERRARVRWGWGGSEHQAVVLICKFSQMTQRLWLCLPSPLPLHLHVPPLFRVSPDASLLSDGRQRHTAGKPGRLLVVMSGCFPPSACSHSLTADTGSRFEPFVTFDSVDLICLVSQNGLLYYLGAQCNAVVCSHFCVKFLVLVLQSYLMISTF